jgi:ribosomal protein S18 acetylase RimI-like enzyme
MSGGPREFATLERLLTITVRECAREDLLSLEWFGLFTGHREIFEREFERHSRGEGMMLVADANFFPVGQLWIDFTRKARESVGIIWALRVIPCLHGMGIGTELMRVAEDILRERDLDFAEIGVEKHNHAARRLYERTGYVQVGAELEEYEYTTPEGARIRVPVDQWILRKALGAASETNRSAMDHR